MDQQTLVKNRPLYTLGEELANSITHGIGVLLSVSALVLLIVRAVFHAPADRTSIYVVGFTIFGSSLILLYLMSTLYHAIAHRKTKWIFSFLDHCAIYVLIAGTYTAFCFSALYGRLGWYIFCIIWFLAIIGMILDIFYRERAKHFSLVLYLAMGWLCLLIIRCLQLTVPPISVHMLFYGGISYTVGSIFYVWRVRWMHSVWHLFVLGGSILHFFSIYYSI